MKLDCKDCKEKGYYILCDGCDEIDQYANEPECEDPNWQQPDNNNS